MFTVEAIVKRKDRLGAEAEIERKNFSAERFSEAWAVARAWGGPHVTRDADGETYVDYVRVGTTRHTKSLN